MNTKFLILLQMIKNNIYIVHGREMDAFYIYSKCTLKKKRLITARENCKTLIKTPDYGHKTILSASKCL